MKLAIRLYCLFLLLPLTLFSQNDCVDAIVVCGNTGFSGLNATGVGVQELNNSNSCASFENDSLWLSVTVNTGGTLGFVLTPESTNIGIDFDFFVFGPNVTCGNIGQAIRCSTTNPQASGSSSNQTGMSAFETDLSEGPGNLGNNFVQWLTVLAGETYFIVIDRPIGASNFSLEWTGSSSFNEAPTFQLPSGVALDIEACDSDLIDDQQTTFDLTQNTSIIIGSQVNVAVTYHTSINDALNGINEVPSANDFTNNTNPQTITARITNALTGCFDVSSFQLNVIDGVNIVGNSFAVCDDDLDGNDANGQANFDLNLATTSLLPNLDLANLTVDYYSSLANAMAGNNAFPNPFYNTVPNEQAVFIKVTNTDGCTSFKEVAFVINPLPLKVTTTLVQCDTGLNPDGFTLFNLNESITALTNNDANLSVTFLYNGNQIPANYTNISNPQQIQAEITNLTTNCSSFSTINLNVNVINPQITIAAQCDIINIEDGFREFDLTTSTLVLTPTETVVFYETLEDALLENNPITNTQNYTNTIPYFSTIYARVEDLNNCSGISSLDLNVYTLPNINRTGDGSEFICTNISNEPLLLDASILEGNTTDYSYDWFFGGTALNLNTYEIAIFEAGLYTVTVTNENNCSATRTIEVRASEIATIADVIVQDATLNDNTATIILDETSNGMYEYSLDYIEGSYQSSNFFAPISAGNHIVYVRDLNGCGIASFPFSVIGMPKFFTPNGDGYNDFWRIAGISETFQGNSTTFIYNRFGALVKFLEGNSIGWDGTLNGKPLPADDYWFISNLDDGRIIKGHFALKR